MCGIIESTGESLGGKTRNESMHPTHSPFSLMPGVSLYAPLVGSGAGMVFQQLTTSFPALLCPSQ